jgi:outer membrane protein OmpA-like peptidoglycan-associated protein
VRSNDSAQQSTLSTPSTTPFVYTSRQSLNNVNQDSLLMKLTAYETEIATLKKNQDDYFKIMESRLMAMELSMNSKSAIGDNERVKQDSTPLIIRDTIYKQTIVKAEIETPTKQVAEDPIVLYFPLNTSTVQPNHIQALAEYLTKAKTDTKSIYLLSGYSDLVGDANYNLKLSLFRAESVKKYLINKGVSEDRIIVRSFGEKFATPTTIDLDRKVEIERLIKQ